MDIKALPKGSSINDVYGELHKQKAFCERHRLRFYENPTAENFKKWTDAKANIASLEEIIKRQKKRCKMPWEKGEGYGR